MHPRTSPQVSVVTCLPSLFTGGLLALLAGGLASVFLPFTVDDAFITFRYARNLSTGLGPVFNPGERVEGYTSFLWMLLLSLGHRLHLDPIPLSKLLGLISTLATMGIVIWSAWLVSEHPRRVGFVAGFGLALCADVALSSVAGLETTFFMLWISAAVARSLWEEQSESLPWSAVLFALAGLTRPEGLAFFALYLVYQVLIARRKLKHVLLASLFFLVLVGPHWAWRLAFYGQALPNTYYAKMVPLPVRFLRGCVYIVHFFVHGGFFFVMGGYLALRQRNCKLRYLLWMAAGGLGIAWWEGGDWMEGHRFLVPVIPIYCLIAAEAFSTAYEQASATVPGARLSFAGRSLAAAVLTGLYVVTTVLVTWNLWHYTTVRAEGYRGAHMALAEWLEAAYPANNAVALMDVGIVGYYTDLRVIDITGLTDATIAHSPSARSLSIFHEKIYDPSYVLDQEPGVIVLVSTDTHLAPDYPIDMRIYTDERFQHAYVLDHTLEHYHDERLGIYTLLVFRRQKAPSRSKVGDELEVEGYEL
jgi:arabinofuranosyltransferase